MKRKCWELLKEKSVRTMIPRLLAITLKAVSSSIHRMGSNGYHWWQVDKLHLNQADDKQCIIFGRQNLTNGITMSIC